MIRLHRFGDAIVDLRRNMADGLVETLELPGQKPAFKRDTTFDLILENTRNVRITEAHSAVLRFLQDSQERRCKLSERFL